MAITQEQIRGLDQLRQRLSQLSTSVFALRSDLEHLQEPLPKWESLSSSAQALAFNLQQIMDNLQSHAQFLKEAHAYPLSSFPGHIQENENMLGQLLRKKLEPRVEDWIHENTVKQQKGTQVNGAKKQEGKLENDELKELWRWAGQKSAEMTNAMDEEGIFQDNFTIAERENGVENVVTGLRRNLDRDSDDDESEDFDEADEDNKMDDVMPDSKAQQTQEDGIDSSLPPMPLESILKFMTTGSLQNSGGTNR